MNARSHWPHTVPLPRVPFLCLVWLANHPHRSISCIWLLLSSRLPDQSHRPHGTLAPWSPASRRLLPSARTQHGVCGNSGLTVVSVAEVSLPAHMCPMGTGSFPCCTPFSAPQSLWPRMLLLPEPNNLLLRIHFLEGLFPKPVTPSCNPTALSCHTAISQTQLPHGT